MLSTNFVGLNPADAHNDVDLERLSDFQVTKYVIVASFILALLDILSTLPDEVAHIWSARFSSMTMLYFINKYSVLLDTSLASTMALWTQDPELCKVQYQAVVYCCVFGTFVSEAILAIRTIALWRFDKYVKVFVVGAYLEFLPFALYCVWQMIVWTEYPSRDVLRVTGCVIPVQDAWPAYSCLIIAETGIIALTSLRFYLDNAEQQPEQPDITRALRGCSAASSMNVLGRTLYRDGIGFYFIMLGVTITNVSVMLFGPEGLTSATQIPLRLLHSALCTRVLLNLRKAATDVSGSRAWDSDWAANSKIATLSFAPGPTASRSCDPDWDELEADLDSESPIAWFILALLDILSTLPDEVTHMWSARFSPMTVVYFVNKYSVIVDASLAMSMALWTQDPEICKIQYQAVIYSCLIGTFVSEAILATRTIALWRFNPYVKVLVIAGYLEFLAISLYNVGQTIVWAEYPSRDVLHMTHCVIPLQDVWVSYSCLIIAETFVIGLTLLRLYLDIAEQDPSQSAITRALHVYYATSSENVLGQTLYRDGIDFYFIVLGVTITNVFVMLFGPEGLTSATQIPLRLIHSALCTRVLLNLRKAATSTNGAVSGAWDHMRTISFAPGLTASQKSEADGDWDEVELRSPTLASGSGWGSDRRTIADFEPEDARV
ncbi:hypothetical protein C8Q76DRAFT_861708 [Earliella scabrosa]|nr:hypothetical protein C8Q76DRAFT_861708 [Earliella scabrosa]